MLYWVIERHGAANLARSLAAAVPAWVAAAAAIYFVSIVVGAYQWYLLLKYQGLDYSYYRSFRTYYAGTFLNNFLPGSVGGDALRVYEVQKSTSLLPKVAAATFFDRMIGLWALSCFSLAAVLYTLARGSVNETAFRHMLLAVSVVFLVLAGILTALLSGRLARLIHRLLNRKSLAWLNELYSRVQDVCRVYRSRPGALTWLLAVSVLVQILRITAHWCCAFSLGLAISPVYLFTFIPIIALAGVIPLNIGGWGLPQSIGTYLYTLPGVIGGHGGDVKVTAAAMAFLPSVVGLVVMLGGGFYFVSGKPAVDPAAAGPEAVDPGETN